MILAFLLALLCASCAYVPASLNPTIVTPSTPHLVAVDTAECETLLQDDAAADSLRQAAARSLDYVQRLPLAEMTVFDRGLSAADLDSVLNSLLTTTDNADWTTDICDRLRLYRVELPENLLVTGYYQPELAASRRRTERFRYPLYRTPSDLVDVDLGQFCQGCAGRVAQGRVHDGQLVPYYSRGEIEAGALAGHDNEIAWLDDPVEAFFLHVQGSAVLRYADGVHVQIGYSGSNGRPYTSIGRLLADAGKLPREAITLQVLKDYLRAHPDEQAGLMARNERYIFFRALPAGPIGSIGVPLTAGRSIAADPRVYPPGTVALLRIQPRTNSSGSNVSRLVFIQDAGAAITGPGRLDVFWGTGSTAEGIAGEMRHPGELYLLLPR